MASTTLWWTRPETFRETPEALALLTDEERAQHQRFIPAGKRLEYLVTRLLVKKVLSQALGCAPGELRLTPNAWGRPELSPPTGLRFNLSHTEGLVVLLTSSEHEVGCDTELLSRASRLLALGPNVFAPLELEDLAALPAAQQAQRAVTLWTLKESYIKARGMGLALALDGFAFRFSPGGVRVEIAPALADDGERWQFKTLTLGAHVISTAIEHPPEEPVEVALVEVEVVRVTAS